ncbi:unnamed protein product [Moneuplotes crassus]|uniref:Uncharacterized protein n=1 Tax=Euplotes crassus TaxID=5936 RepID=A0AAD1XIL6_EUPCR|nr:unnamed protein product [Moneuplotes crassus]
MQKIAEKKAELRRKQLEQLANPTDIAKGENSTDFGTSREPKKIAGLDLSKYEDLGTEEKKIPDLSQNDGKSMIFDFNPEEEERLTQDEITELETALAEKTKIAEEKFKIVPLDKIDENTQKDLFDGLNQRCDYFDSKISKATRKCIDKNLESKFKDLVNEISAIEYKSKYSIWPELEQCQVNRHIQNEPEVSNPGFIKKTIDFYKIDEIGSNFDKKIFDPHSVAQSEEDYFENLNKLEKQAQFVPKIEKPASLNPGLLPLNPYGGTNNQSIPVFNSAQALTGNNTYDDPKFQSFIAQREKEAKMANSLKEEF